MKPESIEEQGRKEHFIMAVLEGIAKGALPIELRASHVAYWRHMMQFDDECWCPAAEVDPNFPRCAEGQRLKDVVDGLTALNH